MERRLRQGFEDNGLDWGATVEGTLSSAVEFPILNYRATGRPST